jgi:bifunctional DNA-binding transcriptional regulator/antitoxin component of YhaV-PrlF toxin-antitoxin module
MAMRTATTKERIGRVGIRRHVIIPREMLDKLNIRAGDSVALQTQANGVLIKPQQVVDPDDVLSPKESAIVAKARREMRREKYVTLAQLEYDLAHKRKPSALSRQLLVSTNNAPPEFVLRGTHPENPVRN